MTETDVDLHQALMLAATEVLDRLPAISRIAGAVEESTRAALMGAEGQSAARYWQAVATLIPAELDWPGRETQGARDPFNYCLPEVRPVTDLMRAGIGSHSDEVGREERRSLRTYGLNVGERAFDVGLRSSALGLRGRLDLAIAVPDRTAPAAEAFVVEYKDSEKAAGKHFKLQLAAYALLLEEAWGLPVRRGYI